MTLVAVYGPLEDNDLSYRLKDKELFNHKLDLVVGRSPTGDVLVVLGDLNGENGSDRAGYE